MDQQRGEYVPPTNYANISSTPLIQNNIPSITRNQQTVHPQDIQNLQIALKTVSNFVTCPYCKNQAITNINKSCSVSNSLCCIFSAVLPWVVFQACRGKDLNCYNAKHTCTRYNNTLANYNAC